MNRRLSPLPAAPVAVFSSFIVTLSALSLGGCNLLSPRETNRAALDGSGFQMRIEIEPQKISLGEHRRVKVIISLVNDSKRLINLGFPNSQRVEMKLVEKGGRVLYTWSDDQPIEPVPGNLAVNPGEKAVYELDLPTRGMQPGDDYIINVYLPAHGAIQSSLPVTPQA
jgi:hypothetical protein